MCSAWGGGAQKWRSEHWKYFLKKKKNARKKRERKEINIGSQSETIPSGT